MLSKNNIVKKSNILNELRQTNVSLIQYRLFCIAVSRLDPKATDLTPISFSLAEYARLMGLKQPRREILREQSQDIVRCAITIDAEDGIGLNTYALFNEFKLSETNGNYFITLDFNPKLKNHLVNMRNNFVSYKLYNTIFLTSYNQMRLYELLKQYLKVGKRTIQLDDLREYLSIKPEEYPIWNDFNYKVIKVAQREIKKKTDITFEYETIKKSRKVVAIRFIIHKNNDFVDQLRIDEFLPDEQAAAAYDGGEVETHTDDIDDGRNLWRDALRPYDFSPEEIDEIQMQARRNVLAHVDLLDPADLDLKIYEYLSDIVRYVRVRETQIKIENLYKYFLKCVKEDIVNQ